MMINEFIALLLIKQLYILSLSLPLSVSVLCLPQSDREKIVLSSYLLPLFGR